MAHMTSPLTLDDVRLLWHDETCPESAGCRDRALHALEDEALVLVVERVVAAALAHERRRLAEQQVAPA